MGDIIAADFMPIMGVAQAVQRYETFRNFVETVLKEGVDFGVIPGTGNRKVLLKPGAEKLTTLFGLRIEFNEPLSEEDWTGERHAGEMFFHYRYRCRLYRGEMLVAEADGSANSWEKKHRWRTQDRTCPECEAPAIKRSQFPPKGNPKAAPGWYCYAKIGGCGANFPYEDERIASQESGRAANPNAADLPNTLLKMAQKRALVAAVLLAVNASDFFTQDLDDLTYGVEAAYLCANCRSTIVGTDTHTPRQIVEATLRGWGKQLCVSCHQAARAETVKPKEEHMPVDEDWEEEGEV